MNNNLIEDFIQHVREVCANPEFVHHKWFAEYHLEIVDKIAMELCDIYAEADRDFVHLMTWLHDYGKILDFDNQYEKTLTAGREKLTEIGFDSGTVDRAISSVEVVDRKDRQELENASIEIKILSSADAASHHTGPFFALWWYENSDKDFKELMKDNIVKTNKDWERKMVLPEVRAVFEQRHNLLLDFNGELPERYLS